MTKHARDDGDADDNVEELEVSANAETVLVCGLVHCLEHVIDLGDQPVKRSITRAVL